MAMPGALLMLTAFANLVAQRIVRHGRPKRTADAAEGAAGGPPARFTTARSALVIAALAPVGLVFWNQSGAVRHHVEYAGIIPRLEQLAGRVGDNDLLIVESRNAGSDLHTLALPLAYIYARNVLVLSSVIPPKRMLEDFVAWATDRYANVYFLGGAGTDLLTRRVAAQPIAHDRFQIPEYESSWNAYPSGPRHKEFEYGLYRLSQAEITRPGPIDLRIGTLDDLNVVRFFSREQRSDPDMVFRWTQGQSTVLLLGVDPAARHVTVWMSDGGRPKHAARATVEVAFNDRVIGTATPVDELREYTFDLRPIWPPQPRPPTIRPGCACVCPPGIPQRCSAAAIPGSSA